MTPPSSLPGDVPDFLRKKLEELAEEDAEDCDACYTSVGQYCPYHRQLKAFPSSQDDRIALLQKEHRSMRLVLNDLKRSQSNSAQILPTDFAVKSLEAELNRRAANAADVLSSLSSYE